MNILFTEEHENLQKMISHFSKEKIAPIAKRLNQEPEFMQNIFDLLSEQRLMGLMLPESFNGTNVDTNSFLITMEEIAKECPAAAFLYNTHLASSLAILAFGSDLLKGDYLPLLAKGKLICALAGTEASGGSSPFAIQTTARKEVDSFILNGTKTFISGAGFADLYLVMAKTEIEPGKTGLSMFLVEKNTPGFTFGKLEEKLGMQELPTGELLFNECRVPAHSLLGSVGGGLQVMGAVGGLAGLGAGAIALGLAQAAADMTKTHLRERTILGQKLGDIGAVQLRFADMMIETQAARSLLYQAAYDRENSKPGPIPSIFQAKINTTEKALKIIDTAIQLHGMYGYSKDLPLEKLYRDARSLTIHFGNNDVMRSNLCKLLLEI